MQVDDEDFSFTPHIKKMKGVSSTMGDFMQGWTEKRDLHVREVRSEKEMLEKEERPFQPNLPAKATNETLLKGVGYAGPVQGWRQHAERYKQAREQEPDQCSFEPGLVAGGKKMGRQRSWGAVVQRLYPYTNKPSSDYHASANSSAGVTTADFTSLQENVREAWEDAGGDVSAGGRAVEKQQGHADSSGGTCASAHMPRMPGVRRYGRPPKETWQYLFESGTRKERCKSMPPKAEITTPTPLEHSLKLLANEGCSRRPLWSRPAKSRSTTPTPCKAQASVRSADAGQRLFEQSEKQRLRQQQQEVLAKELKVADELRECTFRPRINPGRRCGAAASKAEASGANGQDAKLSLYERGVRARLRREQRAEEGAQERAEAELSECTFHPVPYRSSKAAFATPQQSVASVRSSSASPCDHTNNSEPFDTSHFEEDKFDTSQSMISQQPADVTSAVMTMLDDWRREPVHNPLIRSYDEPDGWSEPALYYSPPLLRKIGQQSQQEVMSEEPATAYWESEDMMDCHVQRHNEVASDVQLLLQDWRDGWDSSGKKANRSRAIWQWRLTRGIGGVSEDICERYG